MPKFLNTNDALSEIAKIIDRAEKELVLLSPYISINPTFLDRLRYADSKGISITLVFGKEELDEKRLRDFRDFQNLKLYFSERLHAKCYFNEQWMVITSLNLLKSSEHNWEMGVLLERGEGAYSEAVREVQLIMNKAEPRQVPGTRSAAPPPSTGAGRPASSSAPARTQPRGFCIRCSKEIPLNPDRPYCAECFAVWARYENWDWIERVCHRCGRAESTSMEKPQCYPCFSSRAARR